MNKIKYFFILLIAGASLVSCSKSDNNADVEPVRDFAVQYATDKATIESYLNTHFITVTENPGDVSDMDIKIDSIKDATTQVPIMSYKANVGTPTFPQLKSKIVNLYGVDFELYYLVLREGIGESPMNTDNVLTSYSGSYLTNVAAKGIYSAYIKSTSFEEVKYPQSFFDLTGVVTGWSEVFPEFKSGSVDSNSNTDGTVVYKDFGAGVMFLPSALGYYTGNGTIPSYSPLVFSFKLYKITRLDHDADGIPDYLEDLNHDGYVYDYRSTTLYPTKPATNPDDTDGDGIPDFIDVDDDGDSFTTKLEITKPTTEVGVVNGVNFGPSKYYPYDAFTVEDDPATPNINESLNSEPKGIPAFAATGEPDYTSSGRLRIHLDKAHHTAKP
ncbi:FKBP-type peptidylprolyl isomerase [Flavobacterium sp. Fl-77]|uniref:FKBP-type peptidylprolyl isomerase n=1 Tax=Flavobacterium flavipigmentatum TaxID=2893884 RepID=A0AAJ2VWV7_9FLAO|nr:MULTISPECIES: FKBP-type peptidylprolyl isomerase [unclassified Flavobacterium]MDX6182539.1 FKBP-type peptidylprolyl isomerase [Flavobacterium sp. Fl-33]MDX6185548.1 FKBP-type peptidylprolyl isomerase [Flavobacterium sp. Fl-77]UFH38738.1 FKBP-type peptidylprolyl isomerase [Flavobacterium sp. F-70]